MNENLSLENERSRMLIPASLLTIKSPFQQRQSYPAGSPIPLQKHSQSRHHSHREPAYTRNSPNRCGRTGCFSRRKRGGRTRRRLGGRRSGGADHRGTDHAFRHIFGVSRTAFRAILGAGVFLAALSKGGEADRIRHGAAVFFNVRRSVTIRADANVIGDIGLRWR